MAKTIVILTLLLLSCSGCATYHKEIDTNPPYSPHHFSYHDLDITWQAERSGDVIAISGTVRNIRSYYLQDLELTVRLVNEKGKVIARDTYVDFPNYLPPDKTAPFHMKFALSPGTQANRLHFSYVYWLAEGAPAFRVYEDVPHFGQFASPL